jgi:glycosyltransferase involved in cell wall biosynthesis
MNDLLKFFSNSLKPFGYHITDHKAPNVLRIANLDQDDEIQAFRIAQYGQNLTQDANLDHLVVYLRVCMRKNRNIDPKPRLTGQNIEENTLRCVNSLVKSMNIAKINGKIELIVLDDRSDDEALAKIHKVLERAEFPFRIQQTTTTGQGASLHEQFALGRAQNAITYFVEDDFLHEENGLLSAWDFYKQVYQDFKTHSLIHPQEHQILADKLYPSYIVASPDRHWRTMRHATHTLITHGHIVRDYWDYFENTKYVGIKKKRRLGSEAKTTNRLFKHIPGFSPLTPFAVHLQFENLLPPFYDWKPLWDENEVNL